MGCPVCDLEPTFTAHGSIICPRHAPETVGTHCAPLKEAVVRWNDDDNWIQMGADHLKTRDRTVYPFPAHVAKLWIEDEARKRLEGFEPSQAITHAAMRARFD
ncbi:hypothetical protein D3C84_797930 [compost metagenome]